MSAVCELKLRQWNTGNQSARSTGDGSLESNLKELQYLMTC